jgi:hypothetical protein
VNGGGHGTAVVGSATDDCIVVSLAATAGAQNKGCLLCWLSVVCGCACSFFLYKLERYHEAATKLVQQVYTMTASPGNTTTSGKADSQQCTQVVAWRETREIDLKAQGHLSVPIHQHCHETAGSRYSVAQHRPPASCNDHFARPHHGAVLSASSKQNLHQRQSAGCAGPQRARESNTNCGERQRYHVLFREAPHTNSKATAAFTGKVNQEKRENERIHLQQHGAPLGECHAEGGVKW